VKRRIIDIVYTAVFASVIAVCALITVPFAVPFTMQTFGVFFALLMLGGKRGFYAVLIYTSLGLIGLPVFSGFQGGFSVIFGATGGYIIGFLLASLLFWLLEYIFGAKLDVRLVSVLLGMLVCYTVGALWYSFVYMGGAGIGLAAAVAQCVLPFILPDTAKIWLAFVLCKRLKKYMR
jgi:biotin transport system substrate-specific component